jgi:outer membrane protein
MAVTALALIVANMAQAPGAVAAASRLAQSETAASPKTSRWFVRVGALRALFDSGARITTDGSIIPGSSAGVTDSNTVIFDIGYDLSERVALMFMGGIPPTAKVIGRGSVASFEELGKVRFGPAVLSGIYRLPEWHGFRGYIGGGGAHLFILKAYDRSVTELKVHDSWGPVIQGGVEYRLSRKWEFFADYKHVWLKVNVEGFLAGEPVRARVTLNPDLISTGIKFHFG